MDPNNALLKNMWERFASYDHNAKLLQNNFYKTQALILIIGISASVLSLSQTQACESYLTFQLSQNSSNLTNVKESCNEIPDYTIPLWDKVLDYLIIILPISISVMVAASNYFRSGNKWILLRFTAEQIKREIYYFRTKTEKYRIDQSVTEDDKITLRQRILVKEIEILSNKLMESEVNSLPLQKYEGEIPPMMGGKDNDMDNGLKDLSADEYVKYRLEDQVHYYENRVKTMNTRLKLVQWAIFVTGGIGSFIAAIGFQLWVSLTVLLITSFSTYLMYRQIENLLIKYNQNLVALQSIKSWWIALTEMERKKQETADNLVETTETILQTELASWLQNMQNALIKLGQQLQKEQQKLKEQEQQKLKEQEQQK